MMNRALIAVLGLTLVCAELSAQSSPADGGTTPATASARADSPWAAAGSVIQVQLTKSIDAKKVKKGDEVVARATKYLGTDAGTVIVPKDTKFFGHVTEVQARTSEQKESQMAIAFDHVVLKNGESVRMPMSIQAVIASPDRNGEVPNTADASPAGYPGAQSGGASTVPSGHQGQMEGPVPAATIPRTAAGDPTEKYGQLRINRSTQGVFGIPDLELAPTVDPVHGSVLTSEKSNVKLDQGTFLLLRVTQ